MHVFTYGTLMFPDVWRAVVGQPGETTPGLARGYRIYRVADAVFPGITPGNRSDSVRGVIYLDVDAASLERLDLFEDDFYRRQSISVALEDGAGLVAEAYVVPPENRAVLTEDPWTPEEFVASGGLKAFVERFAGFSRLTNGP